MGAGMGKVEEVEREEGGAGERREEKREVVEERTLSLIEAESRWEAMLKLDGGGEKGERRRRGFPLALTANGDNSRKGCPLH